MYKKFFSFLLPWRLRRVYLTRVFGYQIHPSARIGWAWVFPGRLRMEEGASIDHFTVAVHLDSVEMEAQSSIGRRNWITGFPSGTSSPHFAHQNDRRSELLIGAHSAVTKNHHLDCTSSVRIGKFVTIAGYGSQFLSHSLDLNECRQHSRPITIGDFCFVGTNVVILGGANLPEKSVLGAKSLLNHAFAEPGYLYAGVPARPLKSIPADAKYFHRTEGFVF